MSSRRKKTIPLQRSRQVSLRLRAMWAQVASIWRHTKKTVQPVFKRLVAWQLANRKTTARRAANFKKRWTAAYKQLLKRRPKFKWPQLPHISFRLPKLPKFSRLKLPTLVLPKLSFPKVAKKAVKSTTAVFSPHNLGVLLVILAVVMIAVPQIFKSPATAPATAAQEAAPALLASKTLEEGPIHIDSLLFGAHEATQPPLRVIVPKYQIDLPIVEAPVINGAWEVSETTASHGIGSANPGEIGNVVVFAHAKVGMFGPLRDIQKNELIYILTKDRWHRYQVTDTKLVNPDQIEVIAQTDEEKLTLFTCTGFLDSKRLIVTAVPYRP